MFNAEDKSGQRWAVILSGGEGERMRPFITRWLGHHRPKQYCTFTGEKSLLEEAVGRALGIAQSTQLVTVIGKDHWQHIDGSRRLDLPGRIVEQPANRDTAAGVFLPLTYVLAEDREATVVLLPSDHFVADPYRFQRHLRRALKCAERCPERLFLLAAMPEGPEPDYGWLRTEPTEAGDSLLAVSEFMEKPDADTARRFYAEGCLWNTMVVAGKAATFWEMGWRLIPEVVARLEALRGVLGTPLEESALRGIYADMPAANFSRDFLQKIPERLTAVAMEDVGWSDWGRPERILQSLRGLRLQPAFASPEDELVAA
jgi:mannose-1-phosphate guanylyltransferase